MTIRPHDIRWCCMLGVVGVLCSSSSCRDAGPPGPETSFQVEAKELLHPLLVRQSGSLAEVTQKLPMMAIESHPYAPPTLAQRRIARRGFRALRAGAIERAAADFALLDMEVVQLDDRGRRYVLIRERVGRPLRGWGFFAINTRPMRPYVIEAPHPRNDRRTVEQGVRLMTRLGAQALLVATSFRCATAKLARCAGGTVACGRKKRRWGPYRLSDMAHTNQSLFQVAHEELMDGDRSAVAVQLHGFERRPGRRWHVIVSDGTRFRATRAGIANRLARLIRREAAWPKGVASCNGRRRKLPLCGTQSVQGRHTNGSPDPCRRRALRSSNRFIHMELSMDARTPGGVVEPSAIERALAALWPAEDDAAVPVPGR